MDAQALSAKRRSSLRGRPSHVNVFRVPSNISVTLGLQWNFIGEEPIDLDASCVAFDRECNAVDVVFFNHLETSNKYMVHSGDNRTGEDDGDDDETITFHMSKIPDEVFYMMVSVTSYDGSDFRRVESANMRVINNVDGKIVGTFSLSVVGQHTATLLCVFSRHIPESALDGDHAAAPTQFWDLREINKPCFGYSFCDVLPEMLKLLGIEDTEDIRQRVLTLPDYSLEKTNNVDDMPLSQLRLGLGWDGENDLDASVVMLGENGVYVDHVHAKYGKLRSRDGAIRHSGDKLNGYAVAGDDEFVDVNLMTVTEKVQTIYFLAILYEGLSDALNDVPKCYIRMQNKASPNDRNFTEVARIDLTAYNEPFTALVAFAVVRQSMQHWQSPIAVVGQGTNGRDWVDLFPFLRTFHRLNAHIHREPAGWTDAWDDWRRDLSPFAVRVTFGAVRHLSPQEPHFFRAHCMAWVQDRRHARRFRSKLVSDRDNVHFGESAMFIVNKMDIVRVMVYEVAMVGFVDIPMVDFFGLSGIWPTATAMPNSVEFSMNSPKKIKATGETDTTSMLPVSASQDEIEMAVRQTTNVPAHNVLSDAGDDDLKRDTLPPENHLLVDKWFPLMGADVSGEIHLRVERVPMPEAPRRSKAVCSVM